MSRGRRSAASASQLTPRQTSPKQTKVSRLSRVGAFCTKGSADGGGSNTVAPRWMAMYHSESGSAGRVVLSSKNSNQFGRAVRATGRLTADHVTTRASVVSSQGRNRPVRRQRTSSGPRKNSGYSLAAAPSPSRTPHSTGCRRDQATSPAPANAIASRSQLVNACTNTTGDRATIAASQIRRRDSSAVLQVTTSMHRAKPSAVRT